MGRSGNMPDWLILLLPAGAAFGQQPAAGVDERFFLGKPYIERKILKRSVSNAVI